VRTLSCRSVSLLKESFRRVVSRFQR